MRILLPGLLLGLLLVLAARPASSAGLYDDFGAASLDVGVWDVATWQLGQRTTLGNSPLLLEEEGASFARFTLDTYHPDHPGEQLFGTSIYSDELFSQGDGWTLEARVRVNHPDQDGLVAAVFFFETHDGENDEIDVEFLTNQSTNQALLTSWNDWQDSHTQNDGAHHIDANPTIEGLHYGEWTTLRIHWLPSQVIWEVNGQQAWTTNSVVPDQPMKVHLTLWAPGSDWPAAYDASLAPASQTAASASYSFDVDYVQVTKYAAIPTAGEWGMVALALVLAAGVLAHKEGGPARDASWSYPA